MLAFIFAEHNDVVEVYNYAFTKKGQKNIIHKGYKGRWCIVHSKVHHYGFISTVFGSASDFKDIFVGYSNLIVSGSKINFIKYSGSTQFIQ